MTYPAAVESLKLFLSTEKAAELQSALEKQAGGNPVDENMLLVAGILMTGSQRPSVVTAVVTAKSIEGTPAWDGLMFLAKAIRELDASSETLSQSIKDFVFEAVQASRGILESLLV